jgi:hypothetical protein
MRWVNSNYIKVYAITTICIIGEKTIVNTIDV